MGATSAPAAVRVISARRLAGLAIATGLASALLIIVAASGDGGGDDSTTDTILGLALLVMPATLAAITFSVARSSVLRPVGAVCVVLCTPIAALYTGVALEDLSAASTAALITALATPALLLAAVVRGPLESRVDAVAHPATVPAGIAGPDPLDDGEAANLPPLDVLGPLHHARSHAVRAVVAWLIVAAFASVIAIPVLNLLGWPEVVGSLQARVADIGADDGGTRVTFEAQEPRRTIRWSFIVEESNWELGETTTAYLDEDGNVHLDQQWGLAGLPLLFPAAVLALFLVLSLRRLWGLAIALADARGGSDPPRLGYAAVIDDPSPKTMRPFVALWHDDPTGGQRLPKPDAVLRADDETSTDLESDARDVVVRRAWIDTGLWHGAKPRWVGFEHGVAVPHRRALLGRWYVSRVTRTSPVAPVVPLRHGPPDANVQSWDQPVAFAPHRLVPMVAWRFLLVAVGIALAFAYGDAGYPTQIEEALAQVEMPQNSLNHGHRFS